MKAKTVVYLLLCIVLSYRSSAATGTMISLNTLPKDTTAGVVYSPPTAKKNGFFRKLKFTLVKLIAGKQGLTPKEGAKKIKGRTILIILLVLVLGGLVALFLAAGSFRG